MQKGLPQEGEKNSIPLEFFVHEALHKNGNEIVFFQNHGFEYEEVKQIARDLSNKSPDKRIREVADEFNK